MSAYPEASSRAAASSPTRPATLLAAIAAAAVAALAAIIYAVTVLAAGPDLLKDILIEKAKKAGLPADTVDALGAEILRDAASDDYDTLEARAYFMLVCGGLLLLFTLFMLKGALWARIMVTIFGVATVGLGAILAGKTDESTQMMTLLSWLAVIVAVVAIVLTWLPANGRYAKSAKSAS